MKVLLGIDVGTSGVKAVATDLSGHRLRDNAARYRTTTSGSGAEQDAEHWWNAVTKVVPDVVRGLQVVAVAVTSQAPTLVPVDDSGRPTAPALTWLDRRAVTEGLRLRELAPESRNGSDPFFGTSKLPWMMENRPSSLTQARHVLATNGFIVHRLTGQFTLDDSTASLMQGFDEETGQFAQAIVDKEPSVRLLPSPRPVTEIVGTVTADAAFHTGIPAGTPVLTGGIDSIGSALEAGSLAVGDPLVDMTGFSSVTMLPVPRGTLVPGFIHARHCFEDTDLLITAQVTAGATVDWVNKLVPGTDLRNDEELLTRTRPGSVVMVPSLAGERTPSWNSQARGILDGLELGTDGTDLMLAAMEGNAMGLARDLDLMTNQGFSVDKILSTGGGASSRAWLQIKADVLGLPVYKPENGHGAAQGAATLAGIGVGVYGSVADVRQLADRIEANYEPDKSMTARYREKQRRYEELTSINREARQTPRY